MYVKGGGDWDAFGVLVVRPSCGWFWRACVCMYVSRVCTHVRVCLVKAWSRSRVTERGPSVQGDAAAPSRDEAL